MESKKWYQSKTIWSNLLMALVAVMAAKWPKVNEFVTPEFVAGFFMVVNLVLRAVTKGKIELK